MDTIFTDDPQRLLFSALEERKRKNPGFSLRAFARQLKVSPAQLSQVISGKRPFTPKLALKVADALDLSPIERSDLLATTRPDAPQKDRERVNRIGEDEFRAISDWQHFAILSLSELADNRSDPRWIARRLNIDVMKARDSLDRLKRLGLVAEKGGRIRQASSPIRTTSDVPSEAIRKYHKLNLELATRVIDEVPVQLREYCALTVATHPKHLERAKRAINRFKEELGKILESGEKTEVYTLSIQLFPLTQVSADPVPVTTNPKKNEDKK